MCRFRTVAPWFGSSPARRPCFLFDPFFDLGFDKNQRKTRVQTVYLLYSEPVSPTDTSQPRSVASELPEEVANPFGIFNPGGNP
jgi:hypothetical protein